MFGFDNLLSRSVLPIKVCVLDWGVLRIDNGVGMKLGDFFE